MINRKKLVDKRLKSMEYWLQYSKEFAEIEQKTHNPDLNMNIAPIRAPSPALYNAWDSSYLHDIDYLVDMMVTEKLLTGYFAERQVLKYWLRLSAMYLYQQITREANRRKIANHKSSSQRKIKRKAAWYHVREYRYKHNEAVFGDGAIRMMNNGYKRSKINHQYHGKFKHFDSLCYASYSTQSTYRPNGAFPRD
eukprot:371924_1